MSANNLGKSAIEGGNHAALWHGRFKEGPDAEAVAFETSIYADIRLAQDDITGSKAHVKMLGKQGIIPENEATSIPTVVAPEDNVRKVLKDGQIIIIRGEKQYNIQGQVIE